MKQPAVYIMANKKHGTIYTGVTSNLIRRAYEHKEGIRECFTKRYGCKLLVYYEYYDSMYAAIFREKQLKAGNRTRKIKLIESVNPNWQDLYDQLG